MSTPMLRTEWRKIAPPFGGFTPTLGGILAQVYSLFSGANFELGVPSLGRKKGPFFQLKTPPAGDWGCRGLPGECGRHIAGRYACPA